MCWASWGALPTRILFEAPEHGPGGVGIDDLLFSAYRIDCHLYLEVAFEAGDGIYYLNC